MAAATAAHAVLARHAERAVRVASTRRAAARPTHGPVATIKSPTVLRKRALHATVQNRVTDGRLERAIIGGQARHTVRGPRRAAHRRCAHFPRGALGLALASLAGRLLGRPSAARCTRGLHAAAAPGASAYAGAPIATRSSAGLVHDASVRSRRSSRGSLSSRTTARLASFQEVQLASRASHDHAHEHDSARERSEPLGECANVLGHSGDYSENRFRWSSPNRWPIRPRAETCFVDRRDLFSTSSAFARRRAFRHFDCLVPPPSGDCALEDSVMSRPLPRPWLRAVAAPTEVRSVSDAELVEAVARGDRSVAGELHDRLIGVIDQTVYRVLGRRESDHDDLIQASFEQVVRSLASRAFNGGCSLQTWASRITTHVALNAIRSRQRERRVMVHTDHPGKDTAPSGGERRAEARLELARLQHHLSAMNERHSEILILHDVHGHDLSEIALMLELTVAAAQSRLVRGRRDLRARIEKDSVVHSASQRGKG